jgi:hypothetical protein
MILPRLVVQWPIEWFELWCERAGIMEFEGGLSRTMAEREAEQDIRNIAEYGTQLGLEMKF